MIDEVRIRLGSRDDLTDAWILARLNEAVTVLNREVDDATIQQASTTFDTIADQSEYSIDTYISTAFLFQYMMFFEDPNDASVVKQLGIISRKDMENLEISEDSIPEGYSGYPYYASFYGDTLKLKPTPDDAYTITVLYFKRVSDLELAVPYNDLTNNEYDVLMNGALWKSWLALQDKIMSEYCKEEFYEGLQSYRHAEISRRLKGMNFNIDYPEKTL